jgi:hypothetical protein
LFTYIIRVALYFLVFAAPQSSFSFRARWIPNGEYPFFFHLLFCLFVYVLDNTSCMSCLESECHCWFSSW